MLLLCSPVYLVYLFTEQTLGLPYLSIKAYQAFLIHSIHIIPSYFIGLCSPETTLLNVYCFFDTRSYEDFPTGCTSHPGQCPRSRGAAPLCTPATRIRLMPDGQLGIECLTPHPHLQTSWNPYHNCTPNCQYFTPNSTSGRKVLLPLANGLFGIKCIYSSLRPGGALGCFSDTFGVQTRQRSTNGVSFLLCIEVLISIYLVYRILPDNSILNHRPISLFPVLLELHDCHHASRVAEAGN